MSTENWKLEKDLCRCCHAEGSFYNLGEPRFDLGQEEVYSDMLRHSFNIDLSPVSGILCAMTYTICEKCILRLRDASNFKRQVLLCEERFKDMYRNIMKALSPDFAVNTTPSIEVKQESPTTFDTEIKEELAPMSEDDEDVFDSRFDNDEDDEKTVLEMKLEDTKKNKGKSKPKPKAKTKKTKKVGRPSKVNELEGNEEPQDLEKNEEAEEDKKKGNEYGLQFTLTDAGDGTKDYTCKTCSKVFKNRRCFSQHYKYVHLKLRPKLRTCHVCKLKIQSHMKAAHMEEAHGVPAPICNVCNKKFSFPNQMLRHQKIVHMGEKKYECDSCDMKFSTQTKLSLHAVKHTGIRTFKCEYCEKAFKWKKNLNTHLMMHLNDRRQVCPVCSEAFVQYSSLKYHMTRRHPEIV